MSALSFCIYSESEQPMENGMDSPTQEGHGTTSQPDDASSTYVYEINYLATVQRRNYGLIVV